MRELSVSVVIPAFNEGEAVGAVVAQVREALSRSIKEFEIIVVDDGSADGTEAQARREQARVLRHPINRGYGQSLETGIAAARNDWILMIDADGSYPADQIDRLLEFAPAFDLVIGTRTGVHFWGTPMQATLRWVYLRIASFIVGETVPDANSGLRLLRRSLARHAGPVQCLGFSYSTTMTLSFLKTGRFVKFVPIEYLSRVGKSKVRPLRDILRTLQLMTMVMIAYNPTKLFVTLAAPLAAAAVALAVGFSLNGLGPWLLSSLLCAAVALQCFLVGCLLEAMRMRR